MKKVTSIVLSVFIFCAAQAHAEPAAVTARQTLAQSLAAHAEVINYIKRNVCRGASSCPALIAAKSVRPTARTNVALTNKVKRIRVAYING